MITLRSLPALALACMVSSGSLDAQVVAYVGATIWDATGTAAIRDATMVVENGRITGIGTGGTIDLADATASEMLNVPANSLNDRQAKIEIGCAGHGWFWQSPINHVRKKKPCGCPDCAESGFNPSQPGVLYYIAVSTDDGDTLYKIGITNTSVKSRFPALDLARIRVVRTWRFAVGRFAAEREAEILYQYAGDRYYGPDILVGAGNTELFTHDVLGLDRRDDEHGQPVVDEDANLTSRQVQSDFDF